MLIVQCVRVVAAQKLWTITFSIELYVDPRNEMLAQLTIVLPQDVIANVELLLTGRQQFGPLINTSIVNCVATYIKSTIIYFNNNSGYQVLLL